MALPFEQVTALEKAKKEVVSEVRWKK